MICLPADVAETFHRLIANLTKRAQHCEDILDKLFPGHDPSDLQDLSRDELLGLAVDSATENQNSDVDSSSYGTELCAPSSDPVEQRRELNAFNRYEVSEQPTQDDGSMRWTTSWNPPAMNTEAGAAWHAHTVPRDAHVLPTIDTNILYPMTPWSPPQDTSPGCPVQVPACWGDVTPALMIHWDGVDVGGPIFQPPGPHFGQPLAPIYELGGSVCEC